MRTVRVMLSTPLNALRISGGGGLPVGLFKEQDQYCITIYIMIGWRTRSLFNFFSPINQMQRTVSARFQRRDQPSAKLYPLLFQ
jgi:hypothetical protein